MPWIQAAILQTETDNRPVPQAEVVANVVRPEPTKQTIWRTPPARGVATTFLSVCVCVLFFLAGGGGIWYTLRVCFCATTFPCESSLLKTQHGFSRPLFTID